MGKFKVIVTFIHDIYLKMRKDAAARFTYLPT